MSIVMLSGIFSVFASAAKYTGENIVMYDDLDTPVYTSDQYATMLVDYLDNMLAEMNLVLTKDDIFVGELDVRSINSAFAGVKSLWDAVDSLKSVVGDIGNLDISVLTSLSRNETVADRDKQILYNVLDFLAGNAWVFGNYAEHKLDVGAVQSLISGYMFYIKDLAVGLLYGLIDDDYDYFDDFVLPDGFKDGNGHATSTAVANLLTLVVEDALFGTWTKLNPIIDADNKITADMYDFKMSYEENKNSYDFYGWVMYEDDEKTIVDDEWVCSSLGGTAVVAKGAAAPTKVNEYLNFSSPKLMYPMLEELLVRAYNHILVPWLNRQIINWLREECDIDGYNENTPDLTTKLANVREKNDLAKIINIGELVKSTFTARELVPTSAAYKDAGGYLLNNLNNILGDLINGATTVTKGGESATPLVTPTYTINTLDEDNQQETKYRVSWEWESGSNANLLPNICSLGRFILAICGKDLINGCGGPEMFYNPVPLEEEVELSTVTQSDEELIAYLLRIILNDSIDFCNIPEECCSLKEIGYTLVQQWAWIENPQITYEDYSEETVIEQILKMLVDMAAKSLNQEMDTVFTISNDDESGLSDKSKKGLDYYYIDENDKAKNAWTYFGEAYDPVTNNGLLPVDADTDYGTIITMLACWGVSTYGSIFDGILTLNSNTTDPSSLKNGVDDVWKDLDTILNSLIPIKYNGQHEENRDDNPWIGDAPISAAGDEGSVVKTIIFDYLLGALLEFNLDKVLSLLYYNDQGALTNNTIEKVIVDLLHRVFDLLFPDVFDNNIKSLDGFLDEGNVPAFLYDLIECLGTQNRKNYKGNGTINGRGAYILELAFPIVASIMELDSEQEFGELENFIPDQIVRDAVYDDDGTFSGYKDYCYFNLYNASQGVNTSYRVWDDNEGKYIRHQDSLYRYEITDFTVSNLNGSAIPTYTQAKGKSIYGGESVQIKLSNLSDGMILKVITQYKVYDENGKPFMNGNAVRILTNTKYSYVGSVKDDNSVYGGAVATSGESGVLQYPVSKYINATSNLSDVNGYSIRINNRKYTEDEKKNGKDVTAAVTSVSVKNVGTGEIEDKMLVPNTEVLHMTSPKGSYSFNPVKAYDGATRDGFDDGEYEVTVNMNIEGTAKSFKFSLILYNDYGLVSLTNKAIDKNYSSNDVPDSESNKWTNYNKALEAAAKVALTPRSRDNFLSSIAGAETLATNLTNATADLQSVLTSASAKSVWDAVNSVGAYDYTLTQVNTSDGAPIESVFFKSEIAEYDVIAKSQGDIEEGKVVSDYISADDYAPGAYSKFRSAKNEANDIAFDGMKVIDAAWVEENGNLKDVEDIKATVVEPEDYDTNADAAEAYNKKIAAIQTTYDSIVNYEAPTVSNVQAAYAIAKLELTYSRLIPADASTEVLSALVSAYGGESTDDYTAESAEEYARTIAFANTLTSLNSNTIDRTIGNTTKTENVVKPSMVKKATEKFLKAYKNLETAANTSALNTIYDEATTFFEGYTGSPSGYEFTATELTDLSSTEDAWVYNYFKAFLDAYSAAGEYYTAGSETEEVEFPASKQNEIDKRTEKLEQTLTELKDVIDKYVKPSEDDTVFEINTKASFSSANGSTYSPAVSETMLTSTGREFSFTGEDEKPHTVTKVLFGIDPTAIADACTVEKGSISVIGNGGSGSVLVVKDNSDKIVDAYLIIYFGDNDGNGLIEATDALGACEDEKNTDWDDIADGVWKRMASDINGDRKVDAVDALYMEEYEQMNIDICQNPVGVVTL